MKYVTHWYGFTESDIASLGRRLEVALAVLFEPHESSYLGEYLLDRSGRFEQCLLYFNRDPLWQPGSDPPDEQYFEAKAKDCDLLFSLDVSAESIGEVNRTILNQFPTARFLKSMGYDSD